MNQTRFRVAADLALEKIDFVVRKNSRIAKSLGFKEKEKSTPVPTGCGSFRQFRAGRFTSVYSVKLANLALEKIDFVVRENSRIGKGLGFKEKEKSTPIPTGCGSFRQFRTDRFTSVYNEKLANFALGKVDFVVRQIVDDLSSDGRHKDVPSSAAR